MDTLRIVDAIGLATDLVGVGVIVVGGIIAPRSRVRTLGRDGGGPPTADSGATSVAPSCWDWRSWSLATSSAPSPSSPRFDSVLVLGGIVLIRTFLSFSLEELNGTWPWRRGRREADEEVSAGDV